MAVRRTIKAMASPARFLFGPFSVGDMLRTVRFSCQNAAFVATISIGVASSSGGDALQLFHDGDSFDVSVEVDDLLFEVWHRFAADARYLVVTINGATPNWVCCVGVQPTYSGGSKIKDTQIPTSRTPAGEKPTGVMLSS